MLRTAVIVGAAFGAIGLGTPAWADPIFSQAMDSFAQQHRKKTHAQQQRTTVTATKVIRTTTTGKTANPKMVKPNAHRGATTTKQNAVKQTTTKVGQPKNINLKQQQKNKIQNPINAGAAKLSTGAAVVKIHTGPGKVSKVAFKPAAGVTFVKLGNKSAPIWKAGPKKVWFGNKWKTYVPLTALGVVVLGGAYYYADAYLTVARPYCEGVSPDGCRLNWQRVAFEDGEDDWQCVQYCRRPGTSPPPRTVALVAPPPMKQGAACEISIFSEPGFGGTNATANDEQPRLGEIGWQNQIASVKIAAGTWDFFSDPEFTGETMRLQPGDYADLGPDWARKTGSFMCAQP